MTELFTPKCPMCLEPLVAERGYASIARCRNNACVNYNKPVNVE